MPPLSELRFDSPQIQEFLWQLALLHIIIGAFWCFFGYRIFKIVLALWGLILGGIAGGAIGGAGHGQAGMVIGAIIGGLVGAAMMVGLYFLGVFLLGAGFGALLAVAATAAAGAEPNAAPIIIAAVLAGVLALVIQKLIIILITSFMGAWGIVGGIACITTQRLLTPANLQTMTDRNVITAVGIGWLVVGLTGVFVQYGLTGKKQYGAWGKKPPKDQERAQGTPA